MEEQESIKVFYQPNLFLVIGDEPLKLAGRLPIIDSIEPVVVVEFDKTHKLKKVIDLSPYMDGDNATVIIVDDSDFEISLLGLFSGGFRYCLTMEDFKPKRFYKLMPKSKYKEMGGFEQRLELFNSALREINPNVKPKIGGHWENYLIDKNGNGANTMRLDDIDWDVTHHSKYQSHLDKYRQVKGYLKDKKYTFYDEVSAICSRDLHGGKIKPTVMDFQRAIIEEFRKQPVITEMEKILGFPWVPVFNIESEERFVHSVCRNLLDTIPTWLTKDGTYPFNSLNPIEFLPLQISDENPMVTVVDICLFDDFV